MNPGASRRCFATHLSMTELHSHGHETRSLDRDIKINRCANRPIPPSLCQRNSTKSRTRECRTASLHVDFNSLLRRADARLMARLPSRSCGSNPAFAQWASAWQPSQLRSEGWWSRSGSNRRPQACKARALPTELRPLKRRSTSQVVGPGRVERPTSRLSGVRSNHLSYEPETR